MGVLEESPVYSLRLEAMSTHVDGKHQDEGKQVESQRQNHSRGAGATPPRPGTHRSTVPLSPENIRLRDQVYRADNIYSERGERETPFDVADVVRTYPHAFFMRAR